MSPSHQIGGSLTSPVAVSGARDPVQLQCQLLFLSPAPGLPAGRCIKAVTGRQTGGVSFVMYEQKEPHDKRDTTCLPPGHGFDATPRGEPRGWAGKRKWAAMRNNKSSEEPAQRQLPLSLLRSTASTSLSRHTVWGAKIQP